MAAHLQAIVSLKNFGHGRFGDLALKRVKNYARNTTGQTWLSALDSMFIEKDLLMELKSTDELYNTASEVFLRKERRMNIYIHIYILFYFFQISRTLWRRSVLVSASIFF